VEPTDSPGGHPAERYSKSDGLLADGISKIAKDIVQQLPGKVVDDSFEIRSGDSAIERGKGLANAESSKLLATAVSSPWFRQIQWRVKFAEGVAGWTIHGFATPFPRIIFTFDLLLSEEHWISRAAEATVLQVLEHSVSVGCAQVLDVPDGYFGLEEFIFLHYLIRRRGPSKMGTVPENQDRVASLKTFIDACRSHGIVSPALLRVRGRDTQAWVDNFARRLGNDMAYVDSWLDPT